MRFWNSSPFVPLLVKEHETEYCLKALTEDEEVLVWCLAKVEAVSALSRRAREGVLSESDFHRAKARLAAILENANEVRAIGTVRNRACRLLEVHPLRAADACQIGAAFVACREMPERLVFMCLDDRLSPAASKDGFIVDPGLDNQW